MFSINLLNALPFSRYFIELLRITCIVIITSVLNELLVLNHIFIVSESSPVYEEVFYNESPQTLLILIVYYMVWFYFDNEEGVNAAYIICTCLFEPLLGVINTLLFISFKTHIIYSLIFTLKFILIISLLVFIRGGIPRYRYDFLTKIGWLKFLNLVLIAFLFTLILNYVL